LTVTCSKDLDSCREIVVDGKPVTIQGGGGETKPSNL
jgi:hypothetical protein